MPIRVLLADDHDTFRQSLAAMLQSVPDIVVAGQAATVDAAMRLASECQPDVLLLDVRMGDGNGLDIIPAILHNAPSTAVLMFTMHDDKRYAIRARQAGAKGYFLKDSPLELLCSAIQTVHEGGSCFVVSGFEK